MIVGREDECAKLAERLTSARAGVGGAILLAGEPGIGKTTLLDWLRGQALGAQVLAARGVEFDAELPYAALVELLVPVLDRIDALPGESAVALASALGLGPPTAVDRFTVDVAVLGLLGVVAERGPILLLVDDLQWVDSASREALSFVSRRLAALPVLLVAAQRTLDGAEAPALPRAEVVRVGPLGAEDAALVIAQSGEALSPQLARQLLDAARGNPLALVELPQRLTPEQLEGKAPLGQLVPTGNVLERAFAARLAPLSQAGRLAILVAAADTSGETGCVLTAIRLLGLETDALEEVEARGIVQIGGGSVDFPHPLVRSAAYHGSEAAERRRVHAALADADADPDRRAWHRSASAVGPDASIADALDQAGARALARGAAAAGAAALERAAALTDATALRGTRLLRAAYAMNESGDLAKSAEIAREADRFIAEPLARARLAMLRGRLLMAGGRVEEGYGVLLAESAPIEEIDPELAATMIGIAANLPMFRLDAPAAVALTARATALGDADRVRTTTARTGFALSKTMAGDVEGPSLLLELAREAILDVTEGHGIGAFLGWPLVWVEEYGVARALLTSAVDVQRTGGLLRQLPQSLAELAELDFRTGRWVPALAEAHESMTLFEETGQSTELSFVSAMVARIEAALGLDAECRRHARAGIAADAASGLLVATAYAGAALGLLELGRGDPEAAIVALEPVETIMREGEVGEPWVFQWAPDLVEALCRTGQTDRASAILGGFEAQALATGRISALAAASRCRGMLASDTGFDACFAKALALHKQVPTPFEQARTRLAHGERLRRAGRRAEGGVQLSAALELFEQLGAGPWAERARVELRASGRSIRTPEQRAEDALTPQELQVAAIVAAGATNKEAAAALFLSAKTIEFHLGNVYRKLGIRSRTELARAVDAPAY